MTAHGGLQGSKNLHPTIFQLFEPKYTQNSNFSEEATSHMGIHMVPQVELERI